ncbi:MAG: hypothetical protein JNG88_00620 [Phycisphaerales bacterium]|nr:hypothetical protein [Phycisphaerales bacterium]
MAVTMICPNLGCRKTIVAPDGARGRLMRCAHCSQVFMVPIRDGSSEPATADETNNQKDKSGSKKH